MSYIEVIEKNKDVTVFLNRPDVRNAFNPEMISELTKIFSELNNRSDIRSIVIKGHGKSFCAGADLNWMRNMVNYSLDENKEDSIALFNMFESILNCTHPVIAIVHGAAMGGALGLIASCDVVVCEEQTQLCFSEVKLGIAPAVISAFVNRKTNINLVKPYMLSARIFSAKDALDMGLVQFVGKPEEIDAYVHGYIQSLKECGPQAVRETKILLNNLPNSDWSTQKALTTLVISERRISAEGQEGLNAFLEKRNPSWRNL